MIPGASKNNLVETLDHFDVNRVGYYSLRDFEQREFRPGKLFGLRSLAVQRAKFYYGVTSEEVVALLQAGKVEPGKYIACDSLQVEDKTCLVMNGECSISASRFGVERVTEAFRLYDYDGVLNFRRGISCRQGANETDSSQARIVNRWRDMPSSVVDLIWNKRLVGYVVEFSIYSEPVGLKKKRLLIWEIRKY